MRNRSLFFCLVAAVVITEVAIADAATEQRQSSASSSANGAEAKLGVYQGAGCTGATRVKAFEQWFGRETDQVLEFISWQVLQDGTTWAVRCWSNAGRKSVVYSLPMLPPNGSATLAQGAEGKFDELFRNYATELVKHGYGDSIIRIGWEFNAGWYPWAASKDPDSWVAYWRRIVSVLRSVPGADFKFDWCPSAGNSGFAAERAYPGDDVVDIIGLDFYNMAVDAKSFTPPQRWETRMNMRTGLAWHRDFATRHGKAMSYPEWGTGTRREGGGADDDPYFIEQMAAWIAANNVVYHNYWDYKTKDYDSRLSDGRQSQAGSAFQRAFANNQSQRPKLND